MREGDTGYTSWKFASFTLRGAWNLPELGSKLATALFMNLVGGL